MTLRKEVNIEKRGYEGKNRAEVGIREKNVQGGVQDQGGYRTQVFTVVRYDPLATCVLLL
jgi:hypothetical protein